MKIKTVNTLSLAGFVSWKTTNKLATRFLDTRDLVSSLVTSKSMHIVSMSSHHPQSATFDCNQTKEADGCVSSAKRPVECGFIFPPSSEPLAVWELIYMFPSSPAVMELVLPHCRHWPQTSSARFALSQQDMPLPWQQSHVILAAMTTW